MTTATQPRRIRAGQPVPDFTFGLPAAKQKPVTRGETADEITERLMRRLRATEPRAGRGLRIVVWSVALSLTLLLCAASYFLLRG